MCHLKEREKKRLKGDLSLSLSFSHFIVDLLSVSVSASLFLCLSSTSTRINPLGLEKEKIELRACDDVVGIREDRGIPAITRSRENSAGRRVAVKLHPRKEPVFERCFQCVFRSAVALNFRAEPLASLTTSPVSRSPLGDVGVTLRPRRGHGHGEQTEVLVWPLCL